MIAKIKFRYFAVIPCLLFVGCAATKLNKTWMDEAYQGRTVSNILVIGVTDVDATRRLFEDVFVAQLKDTGIHAVSSAVAIPIPADQKLEKNTILAVVQKNKSDAVIITHLIGIEREEIYKPPGRFYNGYSRGYDVAWEPIDSREFDKERITIHLETNLYDVKTENLIWSAESSALDPKTDKALISDVVKVIIKDLQNRKILPRR